MLCFNLYVDKTAFVAASLGQYAWKVLPMGLCTAPSVFARLMQKVLKSLLGVCATTYLDDIGLYADTVTSHLARIGQTLEASSNKGCSPTSANAPFCYGAWNFWAILCQKLASKFAGSSKI